MKGEKYLFVVSGPSGTGKDTVVAALLKKHPEIQHTVSATTRSPREGEKDGINYHFMSVCLLYTSPSPRDAHESRMPSSA